MVDLSGLILVVPDSEDTERDAVAEAWTASGGNVARLGRFWEPPDLRPESVRVYGPHTFALVLEEIWPITLVSPPDDLILGLPSSLAGRRIRMCELDSIAELVFPVFAKPLVPKLFRARVYVALSDLMAETHGLPKETPVVWAEPLTFTAEARVFGRAGRRHAWSVYEGEVPDPSPVLAFADEALAELPYRGPVVLDVGELAETGQWCVVELNEAWGAGLNGCAADACLAVVAAATIPRTAR